ncbi:hypothetical protein [Taibaiella sp. KBW10]|uniref:hypothetical protein n=1 Tax=Taibaiella sp. KBW10 TaxID=2153357 RepID=UPI000F5A1F70|nr:hypothetical protein [Taibaiella sp. KBW10]
MLAIFLFFLLAIQLIPVRAVGDVISKQRISEEEVHHNNSYITDKDSAFNRFWYLHYGMQSENGGAQEKASYIILDEALIKVHHLEVLIQPPDIV